GIADQEPLQVLRFLVEARKFNEFLLRLLPLVEREQPQAALAHVVDGQDQVAAGTRQDLVAIPRGNRDPTLGIHAEFACSTKHTAFDPTCQNSPQFATIRHYKYGKRAGQAETPEFHGDSGAGSGSPGGCRQGSQALKSKVGSRPVSRVL